MPYLACTHLAGPLSVLDSRGPAARFYTENPDDGGAFRASYGRTGCACIRGRRTVLHLYSYESMVPRFKLTLPFEGASLLLDEGLGYLFVGSAGGNLGVWDVHTGQLLASPALHTRAITCLSRSGDFLATGGEEGVVALWSLEGLFAAWLAGRPAAPLASSAEHGLPLVEVRLDPSGARARPILHSLGGDRAFRTWELAAGERGLVLRAVQEVSLPEPPLGFALGADGARAYVADAKGVRSFLCAREGPLETVCSAASQAQGQPSAQAPDTAPAPLEFTCISCSHASANVFVGTSAGGVLALLPGGGTQLLKARSPRPVAQLAPLDDYLESKEQCLFARNLDKDPAAFSLAAPALCVTLPLQYCAAGRPALLTEGALAAELAEMQAGAELEGQAGPAEPADPGARERIAQDPYSRERRRMAADRPGAAGPGASVLRLGPVQFEGGVYDELNEM